VKSVLYFLASLVLTSNAISTPERHKGGPPQVSRSPKFAGSLLPLRKGAVTGEVWYAPPQPDSDTETDNHEGDDGEYGDATALWTWSWERNGQNPSVTNNLTASGNGADVEVDPFTMTRIRIGMEEKTFGHSVPPWDTHTTTVQPRYTPGCIYARVVKPEPPVGLAEATIRVAGFIRLIADGETTWVWDGNANPLEAQASLPEGGSESLDRDDQ